MVVRASERASKRVTQEEEAAPARSLVGMVGRDRLRSSFIRICSAGRTGVMVVVLGCCGGGGGGAQAVFLLFLLPPSASERRGKGRREARERVRASTYGWTSMCVCVCEMAGRERERERDHWNDGGGSSKKNEVAEAHFAGGRHAAAAAAHVGEREREARVVCGE